MAIAEHIDLAQKPTSSWKFGLPLPVVIFLLALVLPVKFKLGPLALDGIRLTLLILIVPLTLNLLKGKYGRIRLVDIMFFLHAVWMPISLLANNPDRAVEFSGSVTVEFFGGYMLARAYVRTRETFIAMVRFMIMIAVFLLPLAIYEAKTGNPPLLELLNKLPFSKSFGNGTYDPRWGLNRTQVAFQHPIHFGVFSSMLFSFALLGLKDIYTPFKRVAAAGCLGLSVFCSLSSGPLLALLIQLFLIGWAFIFTKVHLKWTILTVLCVIVYILIDLLSNRTPVHVLMTYATFSAHNGYWRLLIFEYGILNVWANPIFGLGLNDWIRPGFMYTSSVDNFWLLHAMRFGLPGFFFLAIGYVGVLWSVGRQNFEEQSQLWTLRRSWMFAFVGISFSLATVHVWGPLYSFLFFLIGAGVWFIDAHEGDIENQETPKSETGRKLLRRSHPQQARDNKTTPIYSRSKNKIVRNRVGSNVGRKNQATKASLRKRTAIKYRKE